MDLLKYELKYWSDGIKYIAGVDEAGRGPLAGPVVAACVILDQKLEIEGINDSKKITPKKRKELFTLIKEKAIDVSIGIANENEIDDLNILQATFLAMKRAVGNLAIKPELLLIDGPYSDIKLIKKKNIVKGDSKSASIGAASIIAKVVRDRIMTEYDKIYPEYGFSKHKGYGTKFHIEQLNIYKATPIHRKSFRIVNSNLPSYKFYEKNKNFRKLAVQIIATRFIKQNYTLIDRDINLDKMNDKIDLLYESQERKVFIKVIYIYNNSSDSYEKNEIVNIKSYNKIIKNTLSEKDFNKKVNFNVILVVFKPRHKPQITILNDEKIH